MTHTVSAGPLIINGGGRGIPFMGWWFSPTSDIRVTALGAFGVAAPGFVTSHDVGIFTDAGVPVVTASLACELGGTSAASTVDATWAATGQYRPIVWVGATRFVSVPNTLLTGGRTYYIVQSNPYIPYVGSDGYIFSDPTTPGEVALAAQIVSLIGIVSYAATSIFDPVCTYVVDPNHWLGPNFAFAPADGTVHEPATLLLLGPGLATGAARQNPTQKAAAKAAAAMAATAPVSTSIV